MPLGKRYTQTFKNDPKQAPKTKGTIYKANTTLKSSALSVILATMIASIQASYFFCLFFPGSDLPDPVSSFLSDHTTDRAITKTIRGTAISVQLTESI
jgi:hypothetical protein